VTSLDHVEYVFFLTNPRYAQYFDVKAVHSILVRQHKQHLVVCIDSTQVYPGRFIVVNKHIKTRNRFNRLLAVEISQGAVYPWIVSYTTAIVGNIPNTL